MMERRLIALLLSGFFLMSVLPFSPSVSFDPLQMGDDDEGQALSEQQIVALESLPASVKVSGRTGNSTVETVQWAVKAGGSKGDIAYAIGLDLSGNAYVTGTFENTAVFGSTSLTSSGDIDIFIAKLNRSGSWQWAVRAGGSGSDIGEAIAVDSSGNIYLTGEFSNTAIFGNTSLTSDGQGDIFIAKLNRSGSWQWAVRAGGSGYDGGEAIAVDSSGNIYLTGAFGNTAIFGTTSLTSSGQYDIFIAKLSTSGSWQWAVRAGSSVTACAFGIAVDSSGMIYVTGEFSNTAVFGSTSLRSSGQNDIFITKLSSSGSWQWAVRAGGPGYSDRGNAIAVDSSGNAYVTGTFENSAVFGSTTLTSNGGLDPFIAKLNSSGSWQWAVQAGGSEYDHGLSIAVDSSGNVYAAGWFQGNASFGSTNLTSNGGMDSFIAKLNSSGSWQSAVKVGSSQSDFWAYTIAVDSSDNAYVAGSFKSTATVGSSNLSSSGRGDIFVYANIVDRDLDGIKNPIDACSNGAIDWKSSTSTDYDSDGCRDSDEDIDDDDDSVMDSIDFCPKGDLGWTSDSSTDYDGDGCQDAVEDIDDDNDGISDETEIDTGSNPLDPDSDADGYQDGEDVFPTDTTEWSDSDGDGVGDNSDAFPYNPEEWNDSDFDEVGDNSDAFPTDWLEWNDSDNDLIGDNSDACPYVFGTSLQPIPGCLDSDSDGWADSDDVFPNDESEWIDSDADGVGDNADSCPLEFGTSTQIERYGCPENNELDANETLDSDGDGVEDNSDNCPGTTNNTVVDLEGCIITTKSTSDKASNFFSDSRTWTAIIVLFVAIIGAAVKVRSGGREKEEESVVQQASAQTNPPMNSLSKPSAQVMANNGIESGYEWLHHEGNNYYRIPGSWSEWTQYQR